MGRIWAVARYTLAQCLRTKVAAVFVVLLVAALVALPLTLKGDGTLAGRIRTFLAYGTAATGILLSIVTVFLSVALVAGDVEGKYVFLLASKPVARWQYITGRWLGVVLVDGVLLAAAAVVIFATSHYLRTGQAANRQDRLAVENEVFAARAKLLPEPITEVEDRRVEKQEKRLEEAGNLQETVQAYMEQMNLSEAEARRRAREQIRKQVREGLQSAGPGSRLTWRFRGIRSTAGELSGKAKVLAHGKRYRLTVKADKELIGKMAAARRVSVVGIQARRWEPRGEYFYAFFSESSARGDPFARLRVGGPVDFEVRTDAGRLRPGTGRLERRDVQLLLLLETEPYIAGRVAERAFVEVDGLPARVEYVADKGLMVRFFSLEARRAERLIAAPGRDMNVVAHPSLQFSYQITPGSSVPGDTILGLWTARSDSSGAPPHVEIKGDPARTRAVLDVPFGIVGPDGDLEVSYVNLTGHVVSILHKDVALFQPAGTFGWNFLRSSMLIMVQLIFLAGLGIFAGSFLSFPVGCLLCFTVLPFSLARAFMAEATELPRSPMSEVGPFVLLGRGVMKVMEVILPDFAETSPGDMLADGLHLSWSFLGSTALYAVGIRALLLIAFACLIFHKRELARVQV
ncbi:MAG: ABC transporter permease [Planctomycetota bacterium]|jgi:hypothetical protein